MSAARRLCEGGLFCFDTLSNDEIVGLLLTGSVLLLMLRPVGVLSKDVWLCLCFVGDGFLHVDESHDQSSHCEDTD